MFVRLAVLAQGLLEAVQGLAEAEGLGKLVAGVQPAQEAADGRQVGVDRLFGVPLLHPEVEGLQVPGLEVLDRVGRSMARAQVFFNLVTVDQEPLQGVQGPAVGVGGLGLLDGGHELAGGGVQVSHRLVFPSNTLLLPTE